MIIAPDWTTLKGIANGLDVADPVQQKQTLNRLLHVITTSLPDVHAVRLYDLEDYTLVVRAATDRAEMSAVLLSDYPHIEALFETGESLWQPEQHEWLCPLQYGETPIGLLEVQVEELDEDWITWLEVIGEQVAARLGRRGILPQPTNPDALALQVERLADVSRMLTAAEGYGEAATATLHAASADVEALVITTFEIPLSIFDSGAEGITNNRWYAVGFANRQEAYELDRQDTVGGMPEVSYIDQLRKETPIVLSNPQTDGGYLLGWVRKRVVQHSAVQVLSFAMIAAEQVIGTLDLLMSDRRILPPNEINLYVTLAKQLGATLLSKRLLKRSLETQEFAAQLVTTNKSLAVAENYEEMAAAVLKDAPPSVDAVAVALFNRPFTLMGNPVSLRTYAVATRNNGVIDQQFRDSFSAQEDARVTYFLHEFLEGRMMLLWNIQRPRRPVMAESLVTYLQQGDVDQITAFGLNMRSSLRGLVIFAGDNTLRDAGPQYDGLRAISDQLAAVIENRILLQQTSDALNLIQNQYAISSRIYRASTLSDILEAVCDFAGGVFSHAQLVFTDAVGITRVMAEITPEGSGDVAREVSLTDYPASQTLSVLEALEVRDVNEDAFLDDAERSSLQERGIVALVILPILSNLELTGLIALSHDAPLRVPPDRLRALRGVADQVGVVLQNRNLLQSMEMNLEEIQILYEANRAMLRTQDIMDVLRVLKTTLAQDVAIICQMGIEYDPNDRNRIIDIRLDYEISREDERLLRESIPVAERDYKAIYNFLRGVQSNVLFSPKGIRLPNNPLTVIEDRYTIESHAALFVKERGQIVSIIYLLFDVPKPFLENTRRLYNAISDQVSIAIDNQKLLQESQIAANRLGAQVKALQTISTLAVQLNRIRDEALLLETGTKALVEALRVDHSGVVLFNEDMQTGVVVSEYPVGSFLGVTVSTKDNPIMNANHDLNTAIVIEDVDNDPSLTETMRNTLSGGGIASLIIMPLVGQDGQLIGSVGLDVFGEQRQFDNSEVQTAQTIAAQMAVGLQNVRLLRETQARAEQLQHISDFSSVTQSTLDINKLVDTSLSNVPRLLDVKHMTVALYDETQDELILQGGWHETNTFRTKLDPGERVSLRNTTTGYVFDTGEYLYLPDAQRGGLSYPHSRTIASLLAMPLRNQGRTIGVISVATHKSNAYTDTDIAVFQQVVNQLAVAMDNARTYTQSQQVAKNKTLANDIAVRLQNQSDLEQMITLAMTEVGKAIGAKRARVRLNPNLEQAPPPADSKNVE